MPRDKFLQQVADYYLRKGADMTRTTFVFPNRRSALFMRKYLQQGAEGPTFMPRMVSVTYFVQQFNDTALAKPDELLFILYNVYCQVLARHGCESQIPDFDSFHFWGSILLKDFDDIDAYMVDAREIYRNLKDMKEIRANYLTPEQIEVIQYLWGDTAAAAERPENFWQHIGPEGRSAVTDRFLSLWEITGEIYDEFVKALDSQPTPLAYSGLQSRRALQRVLDSGVEDFRGMRYVFVGFNVLSPARTLIFKRLKDLGIAEFFWDTASPWIANAGSAPNSAGRFIQPLARAFKMPDDFELQPIERLPDIEIISVPSGYGQTKVASEILNRWLESPLKPGADEHPDAESLVDTAVVMADESLLTPMLHSVNPAISPINVTTGLRFSATPFAALMSAVISLHIRSRVVREACMYYYQDVIEVLQHPHIAMLWPEESRSLIDDIRHNHLYNVSAGYIAEHYAALSFLFTPIGSKDDITQVREYIETVVDTMQGALEARAESSGDASDHYELEVLRGYTENIARLCMLSERYGIKMRERTFLQMIERAMSMRRMVFSGEPLEGLQLMSMMDTRTMDFKRLIIMSMNERVFPKRNYTPSLIPASLRSAYHMPTQDYEESAAAYQFYRLISRAEEVKLLYDNRSSGLLSGEMSRYLSQLLHLHPEAACRQSTACLNISVPKAAPIVVDKTPEVMAELQQLLPGGGRRLSASALKTYLSCPLEFYLQYVKGIRGDDAAMDYIDAASYGSALHKLVQRLYEAHRGQTINEYVIDIMQHSDLERMAAEILDSEYYKGRYREHLDEMPGEGRVVARIIARYVRKMLQQEKKLVPYTFEHAEWLEHQTHEWRVNDRYTVNFTMSIDRVDSCPDPRDATRRALRFIDYKTGSDKLSASNLDQLFESKIHGGMFQLLLYCRAYADIFDDNTPIQPMIYKMQTMATEGIVPLKIGKTEILDYHDVAAIDDEGFDGRLDHLIHRIFEGDNEYPFVQSEKEDACLYCQFKQMCGRYPDPPKRKG